MNTAAWITLGVAVVVALAFAFISRLGRPKPKMTTTGSSDRPRNVQSGRIDGPGRIHHRSDEW